MNTRHISGPGAIFERVRKVLCGASHRDADDDGEGERLDGAEGDADQLEAAHDGENHRDDGVEGAVARDDVADEQGEREEAEDGREDDRAQNAREEMLEGCHARELDARS